MNMFQRKRFLSLFLILVLTFAMAACSGGGGSSASPEATTSAAPSAAASAESSSAAADGSTKITWWVGSWKYEDGRATKVAEDFHAENPDVEVEVTPIVWEGMRDKILSMLMSGQGPDVICSASGFGNGIVATKMLMDVAPVIDEIGRDKFYESAIEWFKYDGVEYGLPYRTDTKCLFYNKDMFEKAGISGPPNTVAEFRDYAKRLTDSANNIAGAALPLNRDDSQSGMQFLIFMRAFGGNFLNADETAPQLTTPEAIQAFQYYTDIYNDGSFPSDVLVMNNDDTRVQFVNGQAAMTIIGPWGVPECNDAGMNYGVARLPGLNDLSGTYNGSGWALCITSFSKHKEEAARFAKFFLQPENDAYLSDALPSIRESVSHERFADENMKVFFDQLNYSHAPFTTPVASSVSQEAVLALQRMFQGEDVETVAAEANAQAQSLIDNAA